MIVLKSKDGYGDMNILYLTMSYEFKTTGLYQSLINGLAAKGHNITIVRGMQSIKKTNLKKVSTCIDCLNVKCGDPFEKKLIKKGLNQISLEYKFKHAIEKFLCEKTYDLILYATPPVTLCNTVKYCKVKYNAKTFLMLKDIFPQNAVDLDLIKKNSYIYHFFRKKEKRYYLVSDYIGCMSLGNVDYVKQHNPEIIHSKLHVFYNSITIDKVDRPAYFNKDKTVFLFGGNLGRPQNIPLLIEIVKELNSYPDAHFIIVGKGTEAGMIKKFCSEEKPQNLIYRSFLPQEEYEEILDKVDVGLISLDTRFTIPNIPSRFQSYLKLKKPVLAITDNVTDLKEMILDHDCGWWCDGRCKEKVVHMIKEICENKVEQKKKGLNGFCYLNEEFNVERNIKQIEKFLNN